MKLAFMFFILTINCIFLNQVAHSQTEVQFDSVQYSTAVEFSRKLLNYFKISSESELKERFGSAFNKAVKNWPNKHDKTKNNTAISFHYSAFEISYFLLGNDKLSLWSVTIKTGKLMEGNLIDIGEEKRIVEKYFGIGSEFADQSYIYQNAVIIKYVKDKIHEIDVWEEWD